MGDADRLVQVFGQRDCDAGDDDAPQDQNLDALPARQFSRRFDDRGVHQQVTRRPMIALPRGGTHGCGPGVRRHDAVPMEDCLGILRLATVHLGPQLLEVGALQLLSDGLASAAEPDRKGAAVQPLKEMCLLNLSALGAGNTRAGAWRVAEA
jgi:hypothetical protein